MGHFNTLYYRRALVSVRAMADPNNDSDSLLTLLTDIAAHPGDLETTDSEMRLPGTDTIDPDKVLVDIERLKTVAATTKKYVNKRVAHIDRKGGLAPGRGRSRLPSIPGPGSAETPRARVGPQDAFRGASGKDLGVPLLVEGRARTLRGLTRRGDQPDVSRAAW